MYVYVRNNVIAQKPTSDPNIQNALGGINAFLVFDAFCLLKMERMVSADISRPHLVHPIHPSIFLFSSCFPLLREFDWSHRPGSFIAIQYSIISNPRITHTHGRRITGITAQAERKAIFAIYGYSNLTIINFECSVDWRGFSGSVRVDGRNAQSLDGARWVISKRDEVRISAGSQVPVWSGRFGKRSVGHGRARWLTRRLESVMDGYVYATGLKDANRCHLYWDLETVKCASGLGEAIHVKISHISAKLRWGIEEVWVEDSGAAYGCTTTVIEPPSKLRTATSSTKISVVQLLTHASQKCTIESRVPLYWVARVSHIEIIRIPRSGRIES
ncbi:hypothetical protein DFP72DRAFT_851447 [Ephemerocybe angulata]|uniref:Uncharacterized protein n=1 Tax=Ephemerocybe angulata TaxID=980116 RepID=A0A8H6HP64_9AGAR|nr:hypothetical protein DFP72DRAFT_851447 [Tulosesus angulatus]